MSVKAILQLQIIQLVTAVALPFPDRYHVFGDIVYQTRKATEKYKRRRLDF